MLLEKKIGITFNTLFFSNVIVRFNVPWTMDVRGASLVYKELKVHSHIAYHHVSDSSSHCNLIFTKIYVMVDKGIKVNTSITDKFGFFDWHKILTLKKWKKSI